MMPRRRQYDPERQPMLRVTVRADGEVVLIREHYLSENQLRMLANRIRRSHRGQELQIDVESLEDRRPSMWDGYRGLTLA